MGGGDSFSSGLIYGFLAGKDPQWAVECGAAHGALAMTTPGDTTMATLDEVLQVMKGSERHDKDNFLQQPELYRYLPSLTILFLEE